MTSIQAVAPRTLRDAVKEAQMRGQESKDEESEGSEEAATMPGAPMRRRGPTARQRGTTTTRRSDGSPSGHMARRRPPATQNPFVMQTVNDDVFGETMSTQQEEPAVSHDDDSSILMDADQENDETRSPKKGKTPKVGTPRRPPGGPVPLGELTLEEPSSSDADESMEAEYPPSPRKSSPSKSPAKRRPQLKPRAEQPESSRDAATRNITPTTNPFAQPLAHDSPYNLGNPSPSPRKTRILQETPKRAPLFPSLSTPREYGGIFKAKSPNSAEKKAQERRKRAAMDSKLWELCGRDVGRWNRGEFDQEPFGKKARRW